jgi:opacity protein-like surface antigen
MSQMKGVKYYSLVVAMMIVAAPASAQFSIGVQGGANMANLDVTSSEDFDTETLTGFMAGLVFDYAIGTNMAISVQPSYIGKGATTESEASIDPEFDLDTEVSLTYIELPILFRYAFGSGNIQPFVEAGPAIAFLTKAEAKAGSATEDVKDSVKSTDFSGAIGAGVNFGVGNNTIFAGARYTMGLSDINDDSSDDSEFKTKGIQLLAGFKLPIGGK